MVADIHSLCAAPAAPTACVESRSLTGLLSSHTATVTSWTQNRLLGNQHVPPGGSPSFTSRAAAAPGLDRSPLSAGWDELRSPLPRLAQDADKNQLSDPSGGRQTGRGQMFLHPFLDESPSGEILLCSSGRRDASLSNRINPFASVVFMESVLSSSRRAH